MLTFRWLGVAGLEFNLDGFTLLIDTFFTRPSKGALISQIPVRPNAALCKRYAPRADAVLVTHPHYDHLLDVPIILEQTGARAYGTPNTCALLALHGFRGDRAICVQIGDRFTLGPFEVEVLPARHTHIPFSRLFNGPLPRRLRRVLNRANFSSDGHLRFPLRLSDYRMDACYSYRIRAGERILLVGNHPAHADALFIAPYQPSNVLETVLRTAAPRLLVPIHWDDFTLPLSMPLRPMLMTRQQGLHGRFPVLRRMDLSVFAHVARYSLPGAVVHFPELFEPYALEALISSAEEANASSASAAEQTLPPPQHPGQSPASY